MRTPLRRLLSLAALGGLLGFTACTDSYGRYDPVATGLLGAGIGAAAGIAIASAANPPRRHRHYVHPPPRHWHGPSHGYRHHGYGRPVYGHGWGHRPRHYW